MIAVRASGLLRSCVILAALSLAARGADAPVHSGASEAPSSFRFGLRAALEDATTSSLEPRGAGGTTSEALAPASQHEALPPFHRRVIDDLGDLARMPLHMGPRQWRNLGIAAVGVAAAHRVDERLRDGDDASPWLGDIRPLGQEAGLALLGMAWIGGRSFHHPRLMHTAEDGFEATLLAAGIITPLLKQVVGRERPREDDGSSDFDGGASFPSGEATQAFALASVIARHYRQGWVDGLVYGLASVIAWQRIESDAHWASDVVAGAAIGTAVGRWVVGRNDARRWSVATDVGFERRQVGVSARLRLGGKKP